MLTFCHICFIILCLYTHTHTLFSCSVHLSRCRLMPLYSKYLCVFSNKGILLQNLDTIKIKKLVTLMENYHLYIFANCANCTSNTNNVLYCRFFTGLGPHFAFRFYACYLSSCSFIIIFFFCPHNITLHFFFEVPRTL